MYANDEWVYNRESRPGSSKEPVTIPLRKKEVDWRRGDQSPRVHMKLVPFVKTWITLNGSPDEWGEIHRGLTFSTHRGDKRDISLARGDLDGMSSTVECGRTRTTPQAIWGAGMDVDTRQV